VRFDPLDAAVERLWLSGVVVVAAAGNDRVGDAPNGVVHAPGNDPFVITVGALDLGAAGADTTDDVAAPWSSYGYTADGFLKPELSAPGRYVVAPVPDGAALKTLRPDAVVDEGHMQLSGTSFAAPVVAGTAAMLLAANPTWTPDQVKGALLKSAAHLPQASAHTVGVGELDARAALAVTDPPNPNGGIDRFVVSSPDGSGPVFDAASWTDASSTDASWTDASWTDASWTDASWTDAAWTSASWTDTSWTDASWTDASWTDAAPVR
jgi:serine protease AprX